MVVQRRHPEDPLPVGQLEIPHLEHDGQGLQHVDAPDHHQQQFRMGPDGHGSHRAPQGQGTGVPHEALGRVMVVNEKAQAAAHDGKGEQRLRQQAAGKADIGKGQHHRDGHTGSQSVQPVSQIHCIGGAHQQQQQEQIVPSPQVQGGIHHRHPDPGAVHGHIPGIEQVYGGHQDLQGHLLFGGEPQVPLEEDLQAVIDEPDDPVAHKQPQGHDGPGIQGDPQQGRHNGCGNHHQPPHGGGAVFLQMFPGAAFPDALAEMPFVEQGQQEPAEKGCQDERGHQDPQAAQHAASPFRNTSSISLNTSMPWEPFSSTTSSGRTSRASTRAASPRSWA